MIPDNKRNEPGSLIVPAKRTVLNCSRGTVPCYIVPEGGTQQSIRGGSAPRSNHLPFYITFLTEKIPFRIPSIDNFLSTPFTYLVELCIALNSCKRTVFKIWKNHETKTFFRLCQSHKIHLFSFLSLLPTEMTDSATLSYYSTCEIPILSYTSSLKMVPLSGGASQYKPL